jgi:hypothetical protein
MITIKQKLLKPMIQCVIFSSLFSASAQQSTLSSGGNATGTGGTSNYSVGQITYKTQIGTNGTVNQGIEHPLEIFTLGNDDFPEITLMMSVYPNPTKAFVNLNIQNYALDNLNYQLFDITGKQIQSQKITTSETQISMENIAASIYLLNVFEQNKLLKTFKIIKNK